MSNMNRVQRWRQQQREAGKDALTIWLPRELTLSLEDIALKRHCSPSDLVQQALTTCYPLSADVTDTVTDTSVTDMSQIRLMLQQELRAFLGDLHLSQGIVPAQPVTDTVTDTHVQAEAVRAATEIPYVTDTVTDTVPDTVTDTHGQPVPEAAMDHQGEHVTDTVADTKTTPAPSVTDTVTATEPVTDTVTVAGPKHRGRKPVLREPILALLRFHTAGLTAAELKVYLKTEKHIGDTLAGMVKAQLLVKLGTGQGLRYQLATAEGD